MLTKYTMALAEKTVNEMIEQLGKGKPPTELTRILTSHAETRVKMCEHKIKRYENKYGSFNKLQGKVLNEKHTLEEERALFGWEATVTELKRLRKLLAGKHPIEHRRIL